VGLSPDEFIELFSIYFMLCTNEYSFNEARCNHRSDNYEQCVMRLLALRGRRFPSEVYRLMSVRYEHLCRFITTDSDHREQNGGFDAGVTIYIGSDPAHVYRYILTLRFCEFVDYLASSDNKAIQLSVTSYRHTACHCSFM
jgi:hypothetical protein